jgi:hypothetical protein
MRRMVLVLSVLAVMVVMMVASALPALAQGPPTVPALPGQAVENVLDAAAINPAIAIEQNECVALDTPGPEGTGHLSGYPDDSPCQP